MCIIINSRMDSDEEFVYVYLDFNEKLTPSIFSNKVFLRVANLHKPNPLVQINDLVFKGSFDECVGTNLFFEEIENPPLKNNLFEKETPIRLKPIISQTKIIRLKQMKLPRKMLSSKQVKESVNLNLNQDYNSVLDKLEQGMLNIEDFAQRQAEDTADEQYEELNLKNPQEIISEPEKEVDSYMGLLGNKSESALLEAKYERLRRLARRPVKRMKSPELVEECEFQYKDAYEYHNLEKQVLQSSDAFRTVFGPIVEESLVGGVDIDRCVLQGLILPSCELNRTLTKDEQNQVLTLDNFANLSLPARYLVLKDCVNKIEDLIASSSMEMFEETDPHGHSMQDICNIFRKLVESLKQHISQTSDGVVVKIESDLLQKEDSYVKYTYQPSEEFLTSCPEIFNVDEWTDDEEFQKQNRKDLSDDSSEEDNENNLHDDALLGHETE